MHSPDYVHSLLDGATRIEQAEVLIASVDDELGHWLFNLGLKPLDALRQIFDRRRQALVAFLGGCLGHLDFLPAHLRFAGFANRGTGHRGQQLRAEAKPKHRHLDCQGRFD